MPLPLFQRDRLCLAVAGFRPVVDQHPGVPLLYQDILYADISPHVLPGLIFPGGIEFLAVPLRSELSRCLSPQAVQPAGDFFGGFSANKPPVIPGEIKNFSI